MTPLRQRMIEDMQLSGLAERTQDVYVFAVKQLAEHYDKSPVVFLVFLAIVSSSKVIVADGENLPYF